MAEYLAHRVSPSLDGIVIRSSQTGGRGRNLVLFNQACRVAQDDPPKQRLDSVQIHISSEADGEEDDGEIIVFETVLPGPPSKEVPPHSRLNSPGTVLASLTAQRRDESEEEEDVDPMRHVDPTLRLDRESMVVLDIKRVKYKSDRRKVRRHRTTALTG